MYPRRCWDSGLILTLLRLIGQRFLHFRVGMASPRAPITRPPHAFELAQDGRIYIEKINGPFLYQLKGTPAECKAGLDRAIAKRLAMAA
jgi:hypothetical protein